MSSSSESAPPAGETAAARRDPLTELETVLAAIRQSAARYASATLDSARVRVRKALLRAALLLSACLLVLLIASVGAVLLLIGASQAAAAAMNLPPWSGFLIVGGTAALLPILLARIGISFSDARSLERTRERIAQRAATTEQRINS